MKGFGYGLSISLAFIIGCVTAPLIVPPLTAQNTAGVQRWEYFCGRDGRDRVEEANRLGAEGWEAVSMPAQSFWCFKRPL